MSEPSSSDSARCRNCGAILVGRYCHRCSQAADIHVLSTKELIHEALEDLTHSDSRLWRTLTCLWFKPGKLTQEFIAGRRMTYLPPIRLYLVLSVIFFLVASVSHLSARIVRLDGQPVDKSTPESVCANIQTSLSGRFYGVRLQHACVEVVRDNGASLLHVAVATMPKALFIFLPLIAFLHSLLYWRPRHPYVEHLLFFLHLHAFYFSVMTLVLLCSDAVRGWPALAGIMPLVSTVLLLCLAPYSVFAIKRVFNQGWPATIFKGLALFAAYLAVLSVTVEGVFVYALLQL